MHGMIGDQDEIPPSRVSGDSSAAHAGNMFLDFSFIFLQLSILLRDSTYAHFSKLDLAGEVVHLQ